MWFLITKIFQGELGIYFARMKRLALVYVVMAVFAILLLAFLITALFILAASSWGALNTALVLSGICLGMIVVLWIVSIIVRRKPAKRAEDRMMRDITSVAGVTALSNAPAILRQVRARKSLMLIPLAGALGYGIYRSVLSLRS